MGSGQDRPKEDDKIPCKTPSPIDQCKEESWLHNGPQHPPNSPTAKSVGNWSVSKQTSSVSDSIFCADIIAKMNYAQNQFNSVIADRELPKLVLKC